MQAPSDVELLADYAAHRSEAAFARLVERYVALVHSAARRQVSDPHLAEEITQAVFILLARKAGSLGRQTVLAGWLCRTAHFAARDALKAERRRQHREQLAAHMDTSPDPAWQQLAPLLDEAVAQLREADRNAIVLRYYEQRPLEEVGAALGIGADAAQKRVARALEKLRAIFTKRGVTLTGAAIAGAVSANAVQAVPVGLAAKISATAVIAGTTLATTTTIVMTTLQKAIIGATLAAAVGTGIYEARQASNARAEVQTLKQQQAPLAEQHQQWQRERDDFVSKLAALRDENQRLNRNTAELLKLRGEVAWLRNASQELALKVAAASTGEANASGAIESEAKALIAKAHLLKQLFEQMPDKKIPELRYLGDQGLLQAAISADLETDAGISRALSDRRQEAKELCVTLLSAGLDGYTRANAGQLPTDISQLKPYCGDVDDGILQRYQIIKTGNVGNLPLGDAIIAEKSAVDEHYDTLFQFGTHTWSWQGIGANKMRGSGGSKRAAQQAQYDGK